MTKLWQLFARLWQLWHMGSHDLSHVRAKFIRKIRMMKKGRKK